MKSDLQIILHVGPHKTGSTSLQRNLHRHRKALAAQNVHFLGNAGAHRHLYSAFMSDPMREYQNQVSGLSLAQIQTRDAAMRDALFSQLRGLGGAVILSNEFLCKMTPEEFTHIRDALSRFGDVHCLYYYRELLPWMASNSQQMAKAGRFFRPTVYRTAVQRIHSIPLTIAQVFGPAHSHFLKFEDAAKQGLCNSLLREFDLPDFDQMGLDETHENESLSDQAVRAMYLYNLQNPLGSGRRRPHEIEQLCALPGQKYRIDGLRPHEIRDYAVKRSEVEAKLGFRLIPPQDIPVARQIDAENARQIAPYLSIKDRVKAWLKSFLRL